MRVAVVGAGWAGLAAAVRATQAGHAVDVHELAPMPGGRARSDDAGGDARDNGQHILLGGYARTLALMRDVGVDPAQVLQRLPLAVLGPDGSGLALRGTGPRLLDALRALLAARGFALRDKLCLVGLAADWHRRGFRCDPDLTVDALLRPHATPRVREALLDPLCVAALNTPPASASAAVFLTVLHDSLFGARDASDLLLPRAPLAQLLPLPATAWLRAHGAGVHLRRRISALRRAQAGWSLEAPDGDDGGAPAYDRVVLATSATEAARLAREAAPAWSATTAALAHEPIVTLHLRAPTRAWPAPMLALPHDDTRHPGQFAFRGARAEDGTERVALVVSAAGPWLERGGDALAAAACAQWRAACGLGADAAVDCLDVRADRRATFRCTAGVRRPPAGIAPGLLAAGDYVDGPYPATLESAVRAGEAAVAAF
jgi:squalene-associated FAD-dependent desaturase